MLTNRSIPSTPVIPVLAYPDVERAVLWLGEAFGFTVRLRIGSHRVQMNAGEGGAVVVREMQGDETLEMLRGGHSVTVRVAAVDAHAQHARDHGANITHEPHTYPYGERQYHAVDLAGHLWLFSETITDTDPADWGGVAE